MINTFSWELILMCIGSLILWPVKRSLLSNREVIFLARTRYNVTRNNDLYVFIQPMGHFLETTQS